jgi:acyl-coenzyme A thioesterase PaaI-like protein
MDADAGTATTRAVGPALQAGSLEAASAFVRAAGLIVDEVTASRVTGHLQLSQEHHTPWGIVHGGVYTTAIESAASRLIAHGEVRLQNVTGR